MIMNKGDMSLAKPSAGEVCSSFSQDPVNIGMPRLELASKPYSYFEFWPAWFFYTPIVLYWILLSFRYRNFGLPMVVNPNIFLGGMVGESKVEILKSGGKLAHCFILPYVVGEIPKTRSLQIRDDSLESHVDNEMVRVMERGLGLPLVVKPEFGCRGAGVRLIESRQQLLDYLCEFPSGRRYMLQKLAPYAAEAGVFYERRPWEQKGRVTSIAFKYRPYVVGDGSSDLKSLILRDARAARLRHLYFAKNRHRLDWVPRRGEAVALAFAGSHCRGSIFRDGNGFITRALSDKVDAILQDFPDFHYGRLDVKFRDLKALQSGKDFCIVELNGVSSEKAHIWDSRASLARAFATLFEQYTTLFKMGDYMKKRGFKVPSALTLLMLWLRELKQGKKYPETD